MTEKNGSRNGASIKINTADDNGTMKTDAPPKVDENDDASRFAAEAPVDDETATDPEAVDDPAALLEAARLDAAEHHDRFLRVSAEFENFKKRMSRELSEFKKFANEEIIRDLLPIVDNLERAVDSTTVASGDSEPVREGVVLTLKEMLKVFDRHGVKAVDAMGQPFDPTYHQAVSQEASADHPDNTVIHQLQKGYTLKDRLIRPALVVVAKATTANSEP